MLGILAFTATSSACAPIDWEAALTIGVFVGLGIPLLFSYLLHPGKKQAAQKDAGAEQ